MALLTHHTLSCVVCARYTPSPPRCRIARARAVKREEGKFSPYTESEISRRGFWKKLGGAVQAVETIRLGVRMDTMCFRVCVRVFVSLLVRVCPVLG
jgi:hypothetical protein